MDLPSLILRYSFLASPALFAALAGLAMLLLWLAFAPANPARDVKERLEGYLGRADLIEEDDLRRPFVARALWPPLRRVLRAFGALMPKRNMEITRQMLVEAGEPGGLTVLDFFGVRILALLALGAGAWLLSLPRFGLDVALRNALAGGVVGFFLPWFWLRARGRARKHEIVRALPDALDMLTIGVEAGLAFEAGLLRVGERWDNALTREFRRAVAEMRVGSSREVALRSMSNRCGVPDLSVFVAVLVQSSQMGVSIAEVLHSQAAEMRMKRRQRSDELARQAGVKMAFPLVFCIFPALFVVILGPALPLLSSALGNVGK